MNKKLIAIFAVLLVTLAVTAGAVAECRPGAACVEEGRSQTLTCPMVSWQELRSFGGAGNCVSTNSTSNCAPANSTSNCAPTSGAGNCAPANSTRNCVPTNGAGNCAPTNSTGNCAPTNSTGNCAPASASSSACSSQALYDTSACRPVFIRTGSGCMVYYYTGACAYR